MPSIEKRFQHAILDLVDNSELELFSKLDRFAKSNDMDSGDIVLVLQDQGFTDLSDSYETYVNDNE